MTTGLKRVALLALPLIAPVFLAACVSQDKYDALAAQNQQLQQQLSAERTTNARLISAIKYTVNSDLAFASGSWTLSQQGKDIISGFAKQLAAYQTQKLLVTGFTDNAPIGPALARQGVTSNTILSQKRAEAVMAWMISQGVKPEMVSAKGMGEANPVATNSTPAGRAQNRRVEITLAGS